MNTFSSSVECSRAWGPSSRPTPDCLKPPKGLASRTEVLELTERKHDRQAYDRRRPGPGPCRASPLRSQAVPRNRQFLGVLVDALDALTVAGRLPAPTMGLAWPVITILTLTS
jgi:hypothetical protein